MGRTCYPLYWLNDRENGFWYGVYYRLSNGRYHSIMVKSNIPANRGFVKCEICGEMVRKQEAYRYWDRNVCPSRQRLGWRTPKIRIYCSRFCYEAGKKRAAIARRAREYGRI